MIRTGISVTVSKDGTGAAIALSDAQKRKLIGEVAAAVEATAKQNLQTMIYDTPETENYKRTGNLINSTGPAAAVSPDTWEVGSTAEYALYVHEGTEAMDPRPYLAEALVTEQRKVTSRARRIAREGGTL